MPLFSHRQHFHETFAGLANHVTEAARLVREILEHPDRAGELLDQLTEMDHQAVELRRKAIAEISAVVVTPLPSEDVHQVASLLAGTVHLLKGTASHIRDLNLGPPREPAAELAGVLVRVAACIQTCVAAFRNRNYLDARCSDLEPLSDEGQEIYDRAVEALFAGSPDPMEVVRWKAVYDGLEHAIQQCHRVENALSSIVLENRG